MEISKSTPYVRYRENISSTLHKGTIHIESEYLDRERKTTIESIEGQTWQNMVNGENKEEDILPRLGMKIEGNEDVLDTVEQHMPIDTIIGDVEPVANEDGTYTYEISTMEGSYAKTLDGENNFSLTSDGLVGDMYIKYNAQGEEVNGNIVMNNGQSNYTIENSNTGEVTSAILKGNTERILIGKNIFDKTSKLYDGWLYQNGNYHEDIGGTFYTTDFIKVKPNTDIVVNNGSGYAQYNDNKECICNLTYGSTTTLSNTKYIRVVVKKEVIDTLQIEYGTVSTDYEEPNCELQSVENPTVITSNSPVQFGKGGRL